MTIFWLVLTLVSVAVEASTAALVAIWFMPATIISLLLAFCNVPIWIQVLVFLVLSIAFIALFRILFKNKRFVKPIATNADIVIGKKAVVTEAIDNLAATGQVKVRGQIWAARAKDENVKYDTGEILDIVAIEGVKLIVKK